MQASSNRQLRSLKSLCAANKALAQELQDMVNAHRENANRTGSNTQPFDLITVYMSGEQFLSIIKIAEDVANTILLVENA